MDKIAAAGLQGHCGASAGLSQDRLQRRRFEFVLLAPAVPGWQRPERRLHPHRAHDRRRLCTARFSSQRSTTPPARTCTSSSITIRSTTPPRAIRPLMRRPSGPTSPRNSPATPTSLRTLQRTHRRLGIVGHFQARGPGLDHDHSRCRAPDNIIIVPSMSYDQHPGDAASSPPTGTNLVYTAHVYPRQLEHVLPATGRDRIEDGTGVHHRVGVPAQRQRQESGCLQRDLGNRFRGKG
jgi:hypothetical protein